MRCGLRCRDLPWSSSNPEFSRLTALLSESRSREALESLLNVESAPRKRFDNAIRAQRKENEVPVSLLGGFSVEARKTIQIAPSQVEHVFERFCRFTVDPRWLIYLPPQMASVQCDSGDYLEHPLEAFCYYRNAGIRKVVVEHKHMGSRAIVIVCRNAEAVKRRFGFSEVENLGCVYTRNGRPFFADANDEKEFLRRLQRGADEAETLGTLADRLGASRWRGASLDPKSGKAF